MADFTRIEFSLDNSSWYELPINPIQAELHDSDEIVTNETLDGTSIQQRPHFDSRVRKLVWKNLPQKDPYKAMIEQLKTYKGIGPMYIRLNRLNFDIPQSIKIKVINFTTTIRSVGVASSPYKMSWDEVSLEYVRVPV